MGRTSRTVALRYAPSFGALFALVLACGGEPGVRATDGVCPVATCSPATPRGLVFSGTPAVGDGFGGAVHAVAVGGTSRIDFFGRDAVTPPGGLPFDAFIAPPGIFTVAPADQNAVRVAALGAGSATLSIAAPHMGGLYDEVSIAAKPVATLEARLGAEGALSFLGALPEGPWVAERGARFYVSSVARAADGDLLVDEGATLRASGATVARVADGWAEWEVAVAADAPALTLELATGAAVATVHVELVSRVDDLHLAPFGYDAADGTGRTILVGEPTSLCVVATSAGRRVALAAPRVDVSGPASATPSEHGPLPSSCASLTATAPGPVGIAVHAAGWSLTVAAVAVAAP